MFCYYVILDLGLAVTLLRKGILTILGCCQEVNFVAPKLVAANGELLKVIQCHLRKSGLEVVHPGLIVTSLPHSNLISGRSTT